MTTPLASLGAEAFSAEDARHMARALQLAAHGRCTTHPNPRVGCVLVRDGRVLGEGWHERAGGAHAEVVAIAAAGGPRATRGATAFVTLEPCNHHGQTPPCVEALLGAGIARVVAAILDPDPRTAGGGLARLAAHGVQVSSGLLADPAERLNRGFLSRQRRGRPHLTLKLAQSLDGRIALSDGASRWLTGQAARRDVHRRRAECDVILTGIGTVIADDPALTVREGFEACRIEQPMRVVVDSRARLPAQSRLASDGGRTLLVHALAPGDAPDRGADDAWPGARGDAPDRGVGDAWSGAQGDAPDRGVGDAWPGAPGDARGGGRDRLPGSRKNDNALPMLRPGAGVTRWSLPGPDGRVDLHALLMRLGQSGCNEVFAECGGTLAGALVDAGLVDELLLYIAPLLLGADGRPGFAITTPASLPLCPRWRILEQRRLGADLCLVMTREEAS